MKRAPIVCLVVLVSSLATGAAVAGGDPLASSPFTSSGAYTPAVPVSAFARPLAWFDPSRLHVSTLVSFGSGWGGGASGLQLTSLTYQIGPPLSLRVGVGNAFGGNRTLAGSRGMFLEGFELAYRPNSAFQFNVQYQDVRSPLQLSPYSGYRPLGR